MSIDIKSLISTNILSGKFKNDLPEIYSLKDTVEDNGWHNKQDVFSHTLSVLKQLENNLQLNMFTEKKRELLKKQLNTKVGNYSRKELLIVSTLLHDIGKSVTDIKDKNGIIRCPGHEFVGSTMIESFSPRFGFDKKDEEFVKKLVFYHGYIFEMLNQIMSNGDKEFYINSYKKAVGDIYYELVLLFYSDLLGSDLEKLNPIEFKIRKELVLNFLLTKQ
jgi:hypothetical protein